MKFKSPMALATLIILSNLFLSSSAFAVSDENSESTAAKIQQICATGEHVLDERCAHPRMMGSSLRSAHMFREDPRDPAYGAGVRNPQASTSEAGADSK
jgi:hypothetical protein